MVPKVADAIAALSDLQGNDAEGIEPQSYELVLADLAGRAVPGGFVKRIWAFGGLQAQICQAYIAYGIRSRFVNEDERERLRAEANLRAALKMFVSMGYLRGAAVKLGQALANLHDLLPAEVVETLERLHFQAPPMHFSLLREQVRNELGKDPEEAFATFEPRAFAAASLGQVHRATLSSGIQLAVKIQYPGIGRAIRADFRALSALFLPLRLSRRWDHHKAQLDDVRKVIELETDYEHEADTLARARAAYSEDDLIVVPRVFREYSTRRVLSMEFCPGVHIHDYLSTNPSQADRNHFGRLIYLALSRLHYGERLLYADPSPGNFLFLPDGRLGLIDFGCVRPYNDAEWNCCRLADIAVREGITGPIRPIRVFAGLADGEDAPPEHLALLEAWSRWMWRPYWHDGPFDFGDERYLREGIELLGRFYSERFTLGVAMAVFTARWYFGTLAMLYRLRAQVDVGAIDAQERIAAGWDAA
jgi:tRNA A-37 threonylcarbamoyl transferase component Bud32